MVQFHNILQALIDRGRGEEAQQVAQVVAERFMGVVSEEGLLLMDVEDIVRVLCDSKKLVVDFVVTGSVKPFLSYVGGLQAQGFNVVVGEKYRHLL